MRSLPLLLLLVVAISANTETSRTNNCGINVTGYKSYMNKSVDVPPKKVADILLAPAPFLLRYKKLFANSKFADQPNTLSTVAVDQWKEMPDGTRTREVTYTKAIKNSHRSSIPVRETQTVDYRERSLRLRTSGRVAEGTAFDNFEASVEICVTPGTVHETDIQIDVLSTYHTADVRIHAQNIQAAANYGLTMAFKAFDYLLEKMVRTHRSDPFEFDVPINFANKVIPVTSTIAISARPTLSVSTVAPTIAATENKLADFTPLLVALGIILIIVISYFCTKRCSRFDGTTARMSELERLEKSVIDSISDETPAPRLVVIQETVSVKELEYEKK